MKMDTIGRSTWYLGTSADTQAILERVLPRDAVVLLCFADIDSVVQRLECEPPPALLIVEAKVDDDKKLKSLLERSVDLQNRTLLLLDAPTNEAVDALCTTLACDFILLPAQDFELRARIEKVFRAPMLNAQLTLEMLHSFGAELTSTEVKLLFCFLSSESRTITRAEIMKKLWGGLTVHKRTFDVHLFNLRKKLTDKGYQILTNRGGSWTLFPTKTKT